MQPLSVYHFRGVTLPSAGATLTSQVGRFFFFFCLVTSEIAARSVDYKTFRHGTHNMKIHGPLTKRTVHLSVMWILWHLTFNRGFSRKSDVSINYNNNNIKDGELVGLWPILNDTVTCVTIRRDVHPVYHTKTKIFWKINYLIYIYVFFLIIPRDLHPYPIHLM